MWSVWFAAAVGAIAYSATYSTDLPFWDEDQYVPVIAGDRPASAAWFLERHVDHLIPIPKAAWLAVFGAFHDFRAAPVAIAVLLAATAALTLVAARRLRGATSAVDVVLPLVTLHWGQAGNLLAGAQLQVLSSSMLAAVALALMAGGAATTAPVIGLSACLLALPFCGGQGLAPVPALAVWMLLRARATAGAQRARLAVAGAAPLVLAAALIVTHRPAFESTTDPARVAVTSLQFAGMAAGPAGGFGWSGTAIAEAMPPLVAIAMAVAAIVAAWRLVRAARGPQGSQATALLAHLAALATLAVSIGVGRGAADASAGLQSRYVTMALPLVWIVVLSWDLFARGAARRVGLVACTVGAACVFAFGCYAGVVQGAARQAKADAAYRALRDGESDAAVAARSVPVLHPDAAVLASEFAALRRARLGPFREDAR